MKLEDRYAVLINQLMTVEKAVDGGKDPLEGALESLICAADFLDGDPAVKNLQATRGLTRLAWALRDTLVGAKPELLKRSRGKGKPSGTSDRAVKATIAATVSLLTRWGEKPEEASKSVAKIAGRIGLKFEGQALEASKVLQWRYQHDAMPMGDRTPSGLAKHTYDMALKHYAREVPIKAHQHDEVEKILKSLKAVEF